jgi:hypothetical protein
VLPSSGQEGPNPFGPLDRAILSDWEPQKHSTCLDKRLRTDKYRVKTGKEEI